MHREGDHFSFFQGTSENRGKLQAEAADYNNNIRYALSRRRRYVGGLLFPAIVLGMPNFWLSRYGHQSGL